MKVLECKFPNAKWNILIVCGVHGNEHYAIKSCWHLYKRLKAKKGYEANVTFLFNVNETGIHYCNREWVDKSNPDNKDFNRAFGRPSEKFEDIVEKVKNVIGAPTSLNKDWNLVIDVHNSLFCAPCALIDYKRAQGGMYNFLKDFKLNPVCMPSTNKGTIKRYAYDVMGIPAVTLECGPMESLNEENDLYTDYIEKFLNSFIARETTATTPLDKASGLVNPKCVEKPLLTPFGRVIEWERFGADTIQGYYSKGEKICQIEAIGENRPDIWVIEAPCNLSIIDVVSSTYAFEGDTLFNYVED